MTCPPRHGRLPCLTPYHVRLVDLNNAVPDPWPRYRQEQARKRREVTERERAVDQDDQGDEDSGTVQ
jgi:hypothetical protein